MDLTLPVRYRGLNLNSAASAGPGDPISGIKLEQVLWGGAPAVGYTEKRSLTDGYDASDVYLGRRVLRVRASVYGLNRADLYDRKQQVMSCIHPTAAFFDDEGAKGYLPLTYSEPTLDMVNFPAVIDPEGPPRDPPANLGYALRSLMVYARPMGQPDLIIDADRTGGQRNRGLAVPLQWGWDIIDPRVYLQDEQVYLLDAASGPFIDVPITNRGDYPTPVNVLLSVPAASGEGTATITVGTGTFVISVKDSTSDQIYRYSARQKVLTVEEEGVEVQRADLLDLGTDDTHPMVLPGATGFTMISGLSFGDGSRLFFNEAYA